MSSFLVDHPSLLFFNLPPQFVTHITVFPSLQSKGDDLCGVEIRLSAHEKTVLRHFRNYFHFLDFLLVRLQI